MKPYLIFYLSLLFVYCKQPGGGKVVTNFKPESLHDTSDQLRPRFDKTAFDTLHGWEFGWALLEPINIASDDEDEKKLIKRLSPGQLALYFFWYLDAEVENGGFIQFYWNGYEKYVQPIKDGLRLLGDLAMLDLVEQSYKEYKVNKKRFDEQMKKDDWSPLYQKLKKFDKLDDRYYDIHDKTMEMIEKYARLHPEEFVTFK